MDGTASLQIVQEAQRKIGTKNSAKTLVQRYQYTKGKK
jgi:hypothetical protein